MNLYMSDDVKKFGEALELKQMHMPKKLYRYRTLSDENIAKYRFGEIVRGELYLSHPDELNDPFEASSKLSSTKLSGYVKDKDRYSSLFLEKMSAEEYQSVFEGDEWFEKLLAFVAEKSVCQEEAVSAKEILSKTVMKQIEDLNFNLSDMTRKMVRLACFTTTPDNLPMWHHYTNGHTGICLEYHTEDISNIFQINRLFPVYYVESVPDMTNQLLEKRNPKFGFTQYLAIHKLKDWSYEDEWRLVYDVGSWYFSQKDVPAEFWTRGKTISFVRPARIIMGMKISTQHEKMICEYAKLAGIPAVKAVQTEYGLKIDE